MKQKDLMYMLVAVVILLVAGYLVYVNLMPKSTSDGGVKVHVVGQMSESMDSAGLSAMTDPAKAKDFSSPVEYTGLNNPSPFGK